jgi:hypothetical protein
MSTNPGDVIVTEAARCNCCGKELPAAPTDPILAALARIEALMDILVDIAIDTTMEPEPEDVRAAELDG